MKTVFVFLLFSCFCALSSAVRLGWNASLTPDCEYILYAHTNTISRSDYTLRTFVGTNLSALLFMSQGNHFEFAVSAVKNGFESDLSVPIVLEAPMPPQGLKTVVQFSTNLTDWIDVGFFRLKIP